MPHSKPKSSPSFGLKTIECTHRSLSIGNLKKTTTTTTTESSPTLLLKNEQAKKVDCFCLVLFFNVQLKTTLSIVVSKSDLSCIFSFSDSKSKNKLAYKTMSAMFITCSDNSFFAQGKARFGPFGNLILFCNKIVESFDRKKSTFT